MTASARPEIHHQHRDVSGGWLRPAVFGVTDGLVSNFALIAGVAGGGAGPGTVAPAGFAGLVAGAFSMATGEYTSVASQSEPDLAARVAEQLSRDPSQAVRIHAREELGVDPDDLPSPWVAAGPSFASFTVGAFLPLLPYLLGATSIAAAAALAALGLFAAGAITARFTRRSWLYAGARQLLLGAAAAAVTYGIGAAVGTGLG